MECQLYRVWIQFAEQHRAGGNTPTRADLQGLVISDS